MPAGYVPSPTDPAYYEALASSTGRGVVDAIGDVTGNLMSAVAQTMRDKSLKEQAQIFRDALVAEGIPRDMANSAALEYAQKGTQELLKAYSNRQQVAAEIKAKNALTERYGAETATENALRPVKVEQGKAGVASTRAGTEATRMATELAPRETGVRESGAKTTQYRAETERDLATQQFDRWTREWVMRFDKDMSGDISFKERVDLARNNRDLIRRKVEKAKALPRSKAYDDPEAQKYAAMTEAEIDAEAERVTDQQISDYEFGRKYAESRLSGGTNTTLSATPSTEPGTVNSLQEAMRLIEDPRTNWPTEQMKQEAIAGAQKFFGGK